jgi:hypothetical protein
MPGEASFPLVCCGLVHARANEYQPQQQETMTNRVATSARKRNVVLVEAFFPLLVKGARDVRGVRAWSTTTRLVVLGRIPPLNIRDRGKVAGPIISKRL